MKTEQQLQLVNFEQAKRLKEAGFDWECTYFYLTGKFGLKNVEKELCTYNSCNNYNSNASDYKSAPTVALALKWFRDVKRLFSNIQIGNYPIGFFYIQIWNKKGECLLGDSQDFATYEKAESALLDELLTLIEKEK